MNDGLLKTFSGLSLKSCINKSIKFYAKYIRFVHKKLFPRFFLSTE